MITFKNFIKKSNKRFKTAIELGSGNCDNSRWLSKNNIKVIAIDKNDYSPKKFKNFCFIKGDYFNIEQINKLNNSTGYDLIFSCCSLCFNSETKIKKFLPLYIKKLSPGGVFYIIDFTPKEKVVTNKTNLYSYWFLEIINKHFNCIEIKKEKVFERKHRHTHNIFQLICYNKT